jgi:hypothetical protein
MRTLKHSHTSASPCAIPTVPELEQSKTAVLNTSGRAPALSVLARSLLSNPTWIFRNRPGNVSRRITDHPVNRIHSLNHSRRGVHAPTPPRVVMIDQHPRTALTNKVSSPHNVACLALA